MWRNDQPLGARSEPSAFAEPSTSVASDHLVGFYGTQAELVRSVAGVVEPALSAGEAAILVGTSLCRQRLETELARRNLDVSGLQQAGRLVMLDAAELLARFMVDGVPDRGRFFAALEPALERASEGDRSVHIYGEMVALLYDSGNVTATIALEDLWNELRAVRPFMLLCGYPRSMFESEEAVGAFEAVCGRHGEVITRERSQPDAERRETTSRLRELEEVDAARDRLVGMIAHDVRGPTTVLLAALTRLRDLVPEDSEDADLLFQIAFDGIDRIDRLAGDLLTAVRVGDPSFTYDLSSFDLAAVVERASDDMALLTGRSIAFSSQAPIGHVLADEQRQRQILDNLLSNAVRHSPASVPVRVTLTPEHDHVRVSVTDDGPGIDPDDHQSLFEPFSRLAPRASSGTGLGLFLVKTLVEGQGGRVWVDSEKGAGASFHYTARRSRRVETREDGKAARPKGAPEDRTTS